MSSERRNLRRNVWMGLIIGGEGISALNIRKNSDFNHFSDQSITGFDRKRRLTEECPDVMRIRGEVYPDTVNTMNTSYTKKARRRKQDEGSKTNQATRTKQLEESNMKEATQIKQHKGRNANTTLEL